MEEKPCWLSDAPKWLKDTQVEMLTGIDRQTLRNWRQKGLGPVFEKPAPKTVRYRLSEIERFMKEGHAVNINGQ